MASKQHEIVPFNQQPKLLIAASANILNRDIALYTHYSLLD